MHAAAQPGRRSPKPMNSASSASPLKAGSDNVQNTTAYVPSQVKGKKRERADLGTEHGKRERTMKKDDVDSGPCRQDSILKVEMEKITDKGGLIDSEAVGKLLQLMVPDKSEKKLDLAGRSILAGVIAATDMHDCLSQFVQLKGLLVLDEWLQEVLKGKIGDLRVPKDSDKSVEEFLLVVLRALDKLPVNLKALQMCNIGKSVNRLRSHKNLEIQKKARGLVDAWKKRVEAEMNITDSKSGLNQAVSWPVRPQILEVSQGGIRQSGGSYEVTVKSSVSQLSASKLVSSKTVQGESTSRQVSNPAASPGSSKSLPPCGSADANAKERQLHSSSLAGASDLPLETVRDEKFSGSSQSYSNSQSFSGEQAKSGGILGKEDVRSPASVSMTSNKTSAGMSRHRKSSNGLPVLNPSGMLREIGTARNYSINKNTTSDKLSSSGVVSEKAPGGTPVEGNSKLIVKISNHGQNPTQDATSDSPDDPSLVKSRASSPVLAESPNPSDQSLKGKTSVLVGTNEVDRSAAVVTLSSVVNENSSLKLKDGSFSSMKALIESCVKYSEADVPLSEVDDAGMNLLASVAAGEISQSCLATPVRSPKRNSTIVEGSSVGHDTEAKCPTDGIYDHNHPGDSDDHKLSLSDADELSRDLGPTNVAGNSANKVSEEKSDGEKEKHFSNPRKGVQQMKENCLVREDRVGEKTPDASLPVLDGGTVDEVASGGCDQQLCEKKVIANTEEGLNDAKPILGCSAPEVEAETTLNTKMEVDVKETKCSFDRLNSEHQTDVMSPSLMQFQSAQGGEQVSFNSCHGMGKNGDNIEMKVDKPEHFNTKTSVVNAETQKLELEENTMVSINGSVLGTQGSEIPYQDAEYIGDNLVDKEAGSQQDGQILRSDTPENQSKELEQVVGSKESKLTAIEAEEAEEAEECSSTTADASSKSAAAAAVSDGDGKIEFDLNEGLDADDGKCLDMNNTSTPGCSTPVRLTGPLPLTATVVSNTVCTSITVTAAAKGPFYPPEDLLKNKVELGWKGSAATSAFRPAEPRKVMEMSLQPSSMPPFDARPGKQSRPLLDIDLNVADERIHEDESSHSSTQKDDCAPRSKFVHEHADDKVSTSGPGWCSGRIDLDLNQADETPELGNCLTSSHRMVEPVVQSRPSFCGPGSSGMNAHRDFDLNNGPSIDEVNIDSLVNNQQARISVQSQQPIAGYRMSNSELGNFSTWFPSTGNTYSAVSLSSIIPDRGHQPFPVGAACVPQRVPGPSFSSSSFGADVYRGPILSSSHTVPFSSGAFQYPVFHVGPSFPLPSTSLSGASANYVDPLSSGRLSFTTTNPQLFGTAATVSSHYPRPFVVCIPEGSNNGSESSSKCGKPGIDLNAGPGGADGEGREDCMPPIVRQISVGNSQALVEDQAKMFQMTGSILKRKEPEGSWDGFKQSSWQ